MTIWGGRGTQGNYHDRPSRGSGLIINKQPLADAERRDIEGKSPVNLFACNKCGSEEKTKKVVVYDMANILCFSCESRMMDEIKEVARRYLMEV